MKKASLALIPDNWKLGKISDFGKVITGSTPQTSDPSNYGDEIPFVTPKEVGHGRYVGYTSRKLSLKGATKARVLPTDSILFVCIGSTIGKVSQIIEESATNQQINSVSCLDGYDAGFLYYQLDFRANHIRQLAGKQAVPIVNKTLFEQVPVLYPPLPEQKKIAEILGACDEAIEAQQKLIELKEKRLKGWMQKLLNFDVRFPEFKAETLMEIPIGDAFKFLKTSSIARSGLSESGEVAYLHYGDIHNLDRNFWSSGCFLKNKAHAEKVEGVTRLQNGDIVIVDASEDYDDVAKCVEIENLENIEAVAGLHTFLMRANPEILAPRFRSFALKENSLKKECKKLSTGISVLGLSKTNLSKVHLKVSTNLKEQKAIGDFLFDLEQDVILEKEKLTQLKRQKKGLMQKLLSGEVPVKFDDTMEDSL